MSDRLDFYSVPVPYRGKIHFRHNYCFEFNHIMAHEPILCETEPKYSIKLLRDTFKNYTLGIGETVSKFHVPKFKCSFMQSIWYEIGMIFSHFGMKLLVAAVLLYCF